MSDMKVVSLPPDTTIHALLRLLSDPNEQVARTIQDQLARLGPDVLPFLEQAGTEDATFASTHYLHKTGNSLQPITR